jgi:hypothetical protein
LLYAPRCEYPAPRSSGPISNNKVPGVPGVMLQVFTRRKPLHELDQEPRSKIHKLLTALCTLPTSKGYALREKRPINFGVGHLDEVVAECSTWNIGASRNGNVRDRLMIFFANHLRGATKPGGMFGPSGVAGPHENCPQPSHFLTKNGGFMCLCLIFLTLYTTFYYRGSSLGSPNSFASFRTNQNAVGGEGDGGGLRPRE